MEIKWTKQALEGFNNIHSQHYTVAETREYKKTLTIRIQEKISLLGTSLKIDQRGWESNYKVIIDKYIVYYSFSADRTICNIEFF